MEVIIERNLSRQSVQVFMRDRQGNNTTFYSHNGEGLVGQNVEQGTMPDPPIKPLIELPESMLHQFIDAFTQAGKELRIPEPQQDHIKGKLQATETHLQDIRKIAFKLLKMEH